MRDKFTNNWLKASLIDLNSVDKLLPFEHLTSVASFLCQQSIEKSFKAVFEYSKLDIIKTHNLLKLYNIVSSKIALNNINEKKLNTLNDLYTDSRYPSEFGLLPDGKPSLEEAREFYEFALSIYEQVKNILENGNIEVIGKSIKLRFVEVKDAEFIMSLRLDSSLNKHLSSVDNDLNKQINWIENYKEREKNKQEYYFIIESLSGESYGTVRLYDFKNNSFCWGSWIIKPNSPTVFSIQSALLVYEFAFYKLLFCKSHFDVRKDNIKVRDFHKRMGAKIVSEDELNYYFEYKKEDYEIMREKYQKFLV